MIIAVICPQQQQIPPRAAANGPYLLHRGAAEIPFFPAVDPILMVLWRRIRYIHIRFTEAHTMRTRTKRVSLKKKKEKKETDVLYPHFYIYIYIFGARERDRELFTRKRRRK